MGFMDWLGKKVVETGLDKRMGMKLRLSTFSKSLLVQEAIFLDKEAISSNRLNEDHLRAFPGFQPGDEELENHAYHFAIQDVAVDLEPVLRSHGDLISEYRDRLFFEQLSPTLERDVVRRIKALLQDRRQGFLQFYLDHIQDFTPEGPITSQRMITQDTLDALGRLKKTGGVLWGLDAHQTSVFLIGFVGVLELYRGTIYKVLADEDFQIEYDLQ